MAISLSEVAMGWSTIFCNASPLGSSFLSAPSPLSRWEGTEPCSVGSLPAWVTGTGGGNGEAVANSGDTMGDVLAGESLAASFCGWSFCNVSFSKLISPRILESRVSPTMGRITNQMKMPKPMRKTIPSMLDFQMGSGGNYCC